MSVACPVCCVLLLTVLVTGFSSTAVSLVPSWKAMNTTFPADAVCTARPPEFVASCTGAVSGKELSVCL